MANAPLRPDDFELFSAMLRQRSGLVLTADKGYLLEARLLPVARKWGVESVVHLAHRVRSRKEEALLRDITEAMTTNESSFFRDQRPFDQLRGTVLPKLLASRSARRTLRIWSAACSSGQEAYSICIVLQEMAARLQGWRIEILGTDLSKEMVDRAKLGVYSQFEVQRGMPIHLMVRYFSQDGDRWRVNEPLRRMVAFREWNLLADLSALGQFDIVFCRNVLIYFDQATKTRVLDAIGRQMPADGILYLGGAETVLGITDRFSPVEGGGC